MSAPSLTSRPSMTPILSHQVRPSPSRGSTLRVESPPGSDDDAEAEEGMTPLDDALERIGLGRYQISLLVLCGFGWMADNMWLQCIAVILPRVQQHFSITDSWIGLMSSSIFAGMMLGAWAWGSYSDSQGRTPAFNLTLLVTSIFGLGAAFAPTFGWLCLALFGLGTGVGGSMPTDGTLFLENIPKNKHYLLTALSAFFSLGAVLTSLLGLAIIPSHSCPQPSPAPGESIPTPAPCDVELQNNGWRLMLFALTAISCAMFLLRVVGFRLLPSAKWLAAAGRSDEAVVALRKISTINGEPIDWTLRDVVDTSEQKDGVQSPIRGNSPGRRSPDGAGYQAINGAEQLPASSDDDERARALDSDLEVGTDEHEQDPGWRRTRDRRRNLQQGGNPTWVDRLPARIGESVDGYLARIDELFSPEWARTTKLVWAVWFLASAGYTMFNVFLPRFLEQKVGTSGGSEGGIEASLRGYVLYTVSGAPGSFLGAWLIETRLGRVRTMVLATAATSLATLVFVGVSSQAGVVLSSMVVSLAATLMYAVIYGFTPEAFPVETRGTAGGIASALSRLAGIVSPVVAGLLLQVSVALPLIVSAVCFVVTACCMMGLKETRVPGGKRTVAGHA